MNRPFNTVPLLDYTIYSGTLDELLNKKKIIIHTINQYSFCIANKSLEFKTALQKAEVLLPDGMAIVAAVRFLKGKKIKKIAGADVHEFILNDLNRKSGKCFYLGSSNETLSKIKTRVSKEFPKIIVETFSPAFTNTFSDIENAAMIDAVNKFQPNALFVGMTAPKQEIWVYKNEIQLNVDTICSIGAVFDFYAGTISRPHLFWIKLRLEWFIRFVKEPKRMWKRYLYYGPVFIIQILQAKINLHKKVLFF